MPDPDADIAAPAGSKAGGAFRTIGELARETGLAPHVLRYWETRFPQLRPLTRAGNRRYYRAGDVALVKRIDALLNREGYTIRGVQQLLAGGGPMPVPVPVPVPMPVGAMPLDRLRRIRDLLATALTADD